MTTMEQFLFSLQIMGKGMLGIFVVTMVIVLIMNLITKLGNKSQNKDDEH